MQELSHRFDVATENETSRLNVDTAISHKESSSDLSPRQKKQALRRKFMIVGVVIMVVGLVAAVLAAQTNLDLRQFAWGGIRVNQDALSGRTMSLEEIAKLQRENSPAAALFTELTQTYFDADVANIDVAEFQVKGVVFKKYDEQLDQTFVYARLNNMPLLEAVPAMWLEQDGTFINAGTGNIVLENNEPVGYFLTTLEGDATGYQTLHFSYDAALEQSAPSSIYISVDFDEPTQEGT